MEKPDINNYPTWKIHARPTGAIHEHWQTMFVEARTAIQAEAILRRKGYEMVLQSAMIVSREPQLIDSAELQAIKCEQCGYPLTGLILEPASVVCPECAFRQPLIPWGPEYANQLEQVQMTRRVFSSIGIYLTVGISDQSKIST